MVGTISLTELDKVTGGSIIRSFFRREMGIHDHSVDMVFNTVHRQLLRARSSSDQGQTQQNDQPATTTTTFGLSRGIPITYDSTGPNILFDNKNPTISKSIIVQTVLTTASAPTSVFLMEDYFFVRRHFVNEPYYCYSINEIRSNVKCLQHKYAIPSKSRWTSYELFYPTMSNPKKIIYNGKGKIRPTLFVLEKNCPDLKLYDFDTGQLLHSLKLDEYVKFRTIAQCGDDMSGFVLQSSRATLPTDVMTDFIVIEYPPLEVTTRCQVLKSAAPQSNGVQIAGGFLYFMYSNAIEICDLREILDEKYSVSEHDIAPYVAVCRRVNTKLPVLLKVIGCFQGHFEINSYGSPPCYITKSATDLFKIFDTEGDEVENCELLQFEQSTYFESEVSCHFHPDDSDRVILCTDNEIRIMRLLRHELKTGLKGRSYLMTDFYKKFAKQSSVPETSTVPIRQSSRLLHRPRTVYWDEPEIFIKWEYHCGMDLFAIMEMSKETLKFHLYNNQDWTPFAVVQPKNILSSPTQNILLEVPNTIFNFTDISMSVTVCKSGHNIEKVYVVSILDVSS